MSLFDSILGNLDDYAAKLGLPAEQVQSVVHAFQEKLATGGNPVSALQDIAKDHGLSADSLQSLLGGAGAGGGAQDMLAKGMAALDKDGDGNPLNDLGGLAKGLFGKS